MALTTKQKEIERMFFEEKLTLKQIAIRRQCSKQAVHKILKLVKKKRMSEKVDAVNPSRQPPHQIRLHGMQFLVEIIYKDDRYARLQAKSNIIKYEGATIKLWKDKVELYIEKDFIAQDQNKATANAFLFLNSLLPLLENDLKVILLKPRKANIRLVSAHYAEMDNEMSQDMQARGEWLHIYTREDGRLWFLIDFSKQTFEAETVHPETAQSDMGQIKDYFNDIRDNEHYKPSELKGMFDKVMSVQEQYATLIQRHLIVQEETLKTLKAIQRHERQRKLGEF